LITFVSLVIILVFCGKKSSIFEIVECVTAPLFLSATSSFAALLGFIGYAAIFSGGSW